MGRRISLDVEWAHSIAPNANIILYEANSSSGDDLFQAVSTAAANTNVSVVSMSSGRVQEFLGENAFRSDLHNPLRTPGGDVPGRHGGRRRAPSGYPAYSPNVVAVGGTSLYINANGSYMSESGWADGAGGISNFEPQPGYQIGKVNGANSTNRTNPDVSMDADPNTGVFVVDSFLTGSTTSYLQVGGTSLATPMWAGLVALADQVRTNVGESTLDGATQTLPRLYNLPSTDFHDITTGNNGFPATTGYDLVTGIGSPVAPICWFRTWRESHRHRQGRRSALRSAETRSPKREGRRPFRRPSPRLRRRPSPSALSSRERRRWARSTIFSSQQIVIAAGQTSGSITVTGIDDGVNTGNLAVIATAGVVVNGTPANGSQSVTLIRLEAGDVSQVTLTTSGGAGPSETSSLKMAERSPSPPLRPGRSRSSHDCPRLLRGCRLWNRLYGQCHLNHDRPGATSGSITLTEKRRENPTSSPVYVTDPERRPWPQQPSLAAARWRPTSSTRRSATRCPSFRSRPPTPARPTRMGARSSSPFPVQERLSTVRPSVQLPVQPQWDRLGHFGDPLHGDRCQRQDAVQRKLCLS